MRPNVARVWETAWSTCRASPTSQPRARARRPCARTVSATGSRAEGRRLHATTWAPTLASSMAIARPMPWLAPVTMATRSWSVWAEKPTGRAYQLAPRSRPRVCASGMPEPVAIVYHPAVMSRHAGAQALVQPSTLTVRTPTLEIGYEAHGEGGGFPVILLHGFPDDARAWDAVAPPLVAAGHRVLVPYLRGYGPTRFLDPAEPRMAQQAAIGQDVLDFMDALGLVAAALAGYDWGGRAACIAAILAPERVRALVTIGGYNVQNTLAPSPPAPVAQERAYWYQWYFNTERGRAGLEKNRRELCKLLWREWSPTWKFDDAEFERTAPSFDNPDFVPVVIHSYRHRHGNAAGDPRLDAIERRLAARAPITVPALILHGGDDAVSLLRAGKERALFSAGTEERVVPGCGHFMPREKPQAVVDALLKVLR